ncbi:MAG: acyl--CoA ligase [Chloroflexi bacterium]|nr:acyl--CoA ligase [Chloroflexota bacterium]
MLPTTVGQIIRPAATLMPAAVALIDGDVELSYVELDERCNRVAHGLRRLGVERGDRVAVLFPNEYRFVESLLGAMRAGAIVVPCNPRLDDVSLRYVLGHSETRVLLVSADLAEQASRVADGLPMLEAVVSGDDWCVGASGDPIDVPVGSDDPAMLPYTSGSTGRPKGALLTHRGLMWCYDAQRKAMLIDHTERSLVPVPLCHVNGMAGGLMPLLLAGGSVVVLRDFEPRALLASLERHRCTFMTGVPALYQRLLEERAALAECDLSALRFVNCGSATAPPELLRAIRAAFGVRVTEGYGLTEGGPVCAKTPRWGPERPGSVGLPFPGAKLRLVSTEDGARELGDDQIGELWVRTPGNAVGYYREPELTAERFTPDGWLKTGDLARRDQDGYYYFVGRRDDMINCGGDKVYPKYVEDVLLRHPDVAAACVVAAPHPTKGAAPVAFVVRRGSAALDELTLRAYFLRHGSAYAHPRRITFLLELPLTSIGKVDRLALTRRAADAATVVAPA